MLYSRAGHYPRGQQILYADSFSPNTPEGACPRCHGIGRVFEVTEELLVPDATKTLRERAIAAWPPAWQGQNLRDILVSLGHDIDKPWQNLPRKTRDWILFTDETPVVPVYAGFDPAETRVAREHNLSPSYMGTFTSARRYVLHSFATTQSQRTKNRVSRFMQISECPDCSGKKLKRESLAVKFAGLDIGDLSQLTLTELAARLRNAADATPTASDLHPEKAIVAQRIASDILARVEALTTLGLGYLSLVELVGESLGQKKAIETPNAETELLERELETSTGGRIIDGLQQVRRLVTVDQKPIGRTPRSNLATYTGLFDHVRKLFASTRKAKAHRYDVGRFSFNVTKGRCPNCEGAGFVSVELLFLPSVYTPCPVCRGQRYNAKTLEVSYRDKNIAEVLDLTVDMAHEFFADEAPVLRALEALLQVGLGYLRLGQLATELSGGEAQRIKLATELQRAQRSDTLYVLDEPTTGLHPADVTMLMTQLNGLVDAGNSVIMVEHNMLVASSSDWVIDIGPGAGNEGGSVVAQGTPANVARSTTSRTAAFLFS